MSKIANKLSRQIMAALLTVAMILPNMTVYASEVLDQDSILPASEVVETVDLTEEPELEEIDADDAQPLLTEDEIPEGENETINIGGGEIQEEVEVNNDETGAVIGADFITDFFGTASGHTAGEAVSSTVSGLTITGFNWFNPGNNHGIVTAGSDHTMVFNLKQKADIIVSTCRYTNGSMTSSADNVITSTADFDGETGVTQFIVKGATGTTTLTFTGTVYIHKLELEYQDTSAPEEYMITVSDDGNGTASADKQTAVEGAAVTLTATPDKRYKLKEWKVLSGGVTVDADGKFTMGTEAVSVQAIFEPIIRRNWDFVNDENLIGNKGATVASGATGTVAELSIDATAENSGWDSTLADLSTGAEAKNGTKITVTVEGVCKVNVSAENDSYTVDGVAATAADDTFDCEGKEQKIIIVMTADNHIKAIDVTPIYYVENGLHDFTPKAANFKIDGFTFDNINDIDNSHGFVTSAANATIKLNLSKKANITVLGCRYISGNDNTNNMVASSGTLSTGTVEEGNESNHAPAPKYTVSEADAGELTLTFNNGNYIHSIEVEYINEIPENTTVVTVQPKVGEKTLTDADLKGTVITFIDKTDNTKKYPFTIGDGTDQVALNGIALPTGTYTVSVYNSNVYVQKTADTSEVTVGDSALTCVIPFDAYLEQWTFNDSAFQTNYTQTAALTWYNGLEITGAFAHQQKYAYMGNGHKIRIPVKANCDIEVSYHPTVSATIGGEALKTGDSEPVKQTYEHKDGKGYVEIAATGETYLLGIKVTYKDDGGSAIVPGSVGDKTWNFRVATVGADAIQSGTGEYEGLKIDATSGKFQVRKGDWALFNNGAIIKVPVDGNCKITVECYNKDYTVNGKPATEATDEFTYTGEAGYVEIKAGENKEPYIGSIVLKHTAPTPGDDDDDYDPSSYDPKIDVWDIGLGTFDSATYNTRLTKDILSAMTFGNNTYEPLDADGILKFHSYQSGKARVYGKVVEGPYTHKGTLGDISSESKMTYDGYIYMNSAGSNFWFEIEAEAGDIVTVYASYNTSPAQYSFFKIESDTIKTGSNDTINVPADAQKATTVSDKSKATPLKFYVPTKGRYAFCTSNEVAEKLVVARVTREHNKRIAVSGTVTTSAGVNVSDLKLQFTCKETGAVKTVKVGEDGKYSVNLYERYNYDIIVLPGQYIISEGAELAIDRLADNAALEKTHDIKVDAVALHTLSGEIKGLDDDADALKKVKISFVKPSDKLYQPEVELDRTAKTYKAVLEEGVTYTIKTEGINDYELDSTVEGNTKTLGNLSTDGTRDITYTKKPVYAVTLSLTEDGEDISAELITAGAKVTFTNLGLREGCESDKDYSYTFNIDGTIELRDGVYKVEVTNSGKYVQNLTSNLVIDGNKTGGYTKEITFNSNITEWDFSSSDWTGMGVSEPDGYKGLIFNKVKNECNSQKQHAVLVGTNASTIQIPIDTTKDWNVAVTYWYSAHAKFENETTPSIHFDTTANNKDTTSFYKYKAGDTLINDGFLTITALTGGCGDDGTSSVSTYIKKIKLTQVEAYKDTITVGATGSDYQTINEALEAVRAMERTENGKIKPVTISIAPGNYEEMLVIDVDNVKLVNASQTPSTALKDKGVNIDSNAVRITSYYGHGYSYYSMGSDYKWNADTLAINEANGYASTTNPGSGTGTYWNATVVISGSNVSAEGIIFENSFNQYVSAKAAQDTIVAQPGQAKEGSTPRATMSVGDTTVQDKKYVERAAALAITNNCSQIYFENCKFIGRQDTLYGGTPTTAAFYDCQIYGGTDYIFGGMTAVFAKCDLVFNTSEDNNDVGYITAAQTKGGRGYLMYNCHVTSTTPGVDTASAYTSKPGYLGRPWEADKGEALFYMTVVDELDSYWQNQQKGKSLIVKEAWGDGLSGKSALSQEYGTYEKSGVDNTLDRVDWATALTPEDAKTKANVSYFLGNDWNPFDGKDMEIKVVAPVYATPAAGEVATNTEVTLAVVTPEDAKIYYTTNGDEPTETTGKLYTGKITIDKDMTIKAIAKKDGYLDERPVAEFAYTVATTPPPVQTVATPTAEPANDSKVAIGESITLNCETEGASIYYTINGDAPTAENGSLYEDGIEIVQDIIGNDNKITIKAIAVKEGMDNSAVAEFTYTYDPNKKAKASIPTANPAAGAVPAGTVVKLSTATKGADIYYITGTDKNTMSDPDVNSTKYTDAGITINEAVVIKAIAIKDGMDPSQVATLEYTIDDGSGGNGDNDGNKNGLEIILNKKDYTYTGSAIIPDYTVTYDGKPLIPDVEYTVKCSNNVKVADEKAAITVTGKGNLSGKTVATFNIKQKSLSNADISGAGAIDGDKLLALEGAKAAPVLIYNGKKLAANKDFVFDDDTTYKNKKDWTAEDNGKTVKVKAKEGGSFKDSRDLTVVFVSKEEQRNAKLVVTLDNNANKNIIYDGTPKEPAFISVENKGKTKTLVKGTDYIVSYPSDKTSAGKKTFTVTGISKDCVGTVTKTYTVKPAPMDEAKVKVELDSKEVSTDNTKLRFVSTGVTFANDKLKVKYDGKDMVQGVDYKITYSANKKVGTGKYTVIGLGNYKGVKKSGSFTIDAAAMSDANVTVIVPDVVLGKAKVYKSAPYVIEKDTNTLLKTSNYKVTYWSDAEATKPLGKSSEAGTAYVKIEGKGGYDSATFITKSYAIKAVESTIQDLSTAKIAFYDAAGAAKPARNFSYTGKAVQPYSMKITFKGNATPVEVVLNKEATGFDNTLYSKFEITFVNNTNKGTASVIVKAKDDSYVGGKTATFKIAARNLKDFTWGSASASSLFNLFK